MAKDKTQNPTVEVFIESGISQEELDEIIDVITEKAEALNLQVVIFAKKGVEDGELAQ